MDETEERLTEELRIKRICRFCLTQEEPLSDIYSNDVIEGNSKAAKATPLTLQIMACVSIEVYKDDGMPSTICDDCRRLMDHSYRFKQICKKADTLLKTYPMTGVWPGRLQIPKDLLKSTQPPPTPVIKPSTVAAEAGANHSQAKSVTTLGGTTLKKVVPTASNRDHETKVVKKIVNVTAKSPLKKPQTAIEPAKAEESETEENEEDVKPKIVQLSIADLKNIKQGRPINKMQLIKKASPISKDIEVEVVRCEEFPQMTRSSQNATASGSTNNPNKKPVKLINGNIGNVNKKPVILNSLKPTKKTEEHFVQTADGTLEIISTETQELDPIKNAPPVETYVFPCTECERSFPLRQLLEIHMQNHTRERNHPCEMCDKRFFSKYDLAKHNLTHTGERPFVCVICKSAFSRSTLLTRHQKVHKDQPKFLCIYCERTFLSNEELQKHTENHQKKRPFQCDKCPKSFAYKQGLERHEVTHETNLPFSCEHCNLSFATAGKLARHLTAHAGSRPYPCRMCSRAFMLSHHLTRHVRSHQGGRGAYKCNDCSSIFNSQDELIYHSAVHATESLTCPLCRDHFDTLELVTEHIKQHSEGIQYACDYCDLLFTTAERLDSHCQQEHIAVLAMDRTETDPEDSIDDSSEATQQLIIEEIAINTDGSKMITTFVDGEQKEKKFVQKAPGVVVKHEGNVDIMDVHDQYSDEEGDVEGEEQETYFVDDEDIAEEQVEQPKVLNRVQTGIKIDPKKQELKKADVVPQSSATKPEAVSDTFKTKQKKLDSFFKKAENNGAQSTTKSVGDVLKNLPKGVVIKRSMTTTSNTANIKPEPKLSPIAKTEVTKPMSTRVTDQQKSPTTTTVVQPKTERKIVSPKAVAEKSQSVKSPPAKTAMKRPNEDKSEGTPVKKLAVDPKTIRTASSPSKSVAKAVSTATTRAVRPVATPSPAPSTSVKKGKTFEMKIGDKMVKVQKVVMTKAEVAAMARDGKIEMQGDKMILKQPKVKK
ncbi:RE1-silencing transcription factor-like [Toxorhynchites rutilus septentrionalis]|uniref:RE1-silencing transcription factor-like n=1 Tax=Toxorhynchites rutilus septentrionalis TaxID=329112 RepID=UPI00247B2442|nr:RE1-silencing transcription factor-like [Toxorhynchites rutilus septentrionalis]